MGIFDWFRSKGSIITNMNETNKNNGGEKSMINLDKGSRINLDKDDRGSDITRLTIGCGWTPASRGPSIDVDLSAAGYDEKGNSAELTYFGDKQGLRGVQSLGDNTTGVGSGDDETLLVDLNKINKSITKVVIFINIYSAKSRGQNLSMMKDTYVKVYNNGYTYAEYKVENMPAVTGMVLCEMNRTSNGWEFISIGKPIDIDSIANESVTYEKLMY